MVIDRRYEKIDMFLKEVPLIPSNKFFNSIAEGEPEFSNLDSF